MTTQTTQTALEHTTPSEQLSRAAVEEEIAAVRARRAEFERAVLSASEAAEKAEGEAHHARLVTAVRKNRPAPSRESLDTAEAAVRRAKEQLLAFDAALADLGAECQAAISRELHAKRAADAAEIIRLRGVRPALEETLRIAQAALNEHDARYRRLMDDHSAHNWAPPAP
jgi:chromosome segregation ATPase